MSAEQKAACESTGTKCRDEIGAVGHPAAALWPTVFVVGVFAALWVDLIRQLSYNWNADEQYAYGWFVPILMVGLIIRKWPTRPPAFRDLAVASSSHPVAPAAFGSLILKVLVFALVVLLIPVRVVHEINQDWPFCSWFLTLGIVGISLYAVYLAGGGPWVRHFAFPICFILVAVRWPGRIEQPLIQGLMRAVAAISVEALGWLNVPALQRGNLIELANGAVGVNEACSGIRSLQSTVMAALFMGELYLFLWPFRLLLLVTGLAIAFLLNVSRAVFLAFQANAGAGAVQKWHDPAGFIIVLICFGCLWLLAWALRAKGKTTKADDGENVAGQRPQTFGTDADPSTIHPQLSHRGLVVPRKLNRFALVIGCWLACVLTFTAFWYRGDERANPEVFHWSVTLPTTNILAFEKIPFTARTFELLDYDTGIGGRWQEPGGAEWTLFFCRWQQKSVQSIMHAKDHRPDICLPASGLRHVSDSALEYISAGPLKLPFRTSTYSADGRMEYVFYCLWLDGDEKREQVRSLGPADRLEWVRAGRRRLSQRTLELILSGYRNQDEAKKALQARLPDLIQFKGRSMASAPSTTRQ